MDDMIGIIFMLVGTIIPLAAVGTIIYVIINNVKNKDTKFRLSAKFLLQIYLYVISLLTLAIAVVGGVTAIKAGLSYVVDIPFSYTLYKANSFDDAKQYDPTIIREDFQVCNEGRPITIDSGTYCFNEQLQATDLLNGITIFMSMVILFAIHQYALSRIKKAERINWLYKVYIFLSLILYSIAGLISIPISIYQLTNYLIMDPSKYGYSTPEAPAVAIGIALLTVPLWIVFLRKTTQLREKED